MSDSRFFIFIGRSGSGKGTQAELLKKALEEKGEEFSYIETGQRFRDYIARGTYSSKLSGEIMDAGGLQPSFLAIHMWSHDLIENVNGDNHIIIDGSPRKEDEARILVEALRFYDYKSIEVINIDVSREWSIERLTARGRADDHGEEIKKRLDWYDTDVKPALEYLRNQSDVIIHDINGEQSIEDVSKEIISKIF